MGQQLHAMLELPAPLPANGHRVWKTVGWKGAVLLWNEEVIKALNPPKNRNNYIERLKKSVFRLRDC